MTCGAPTGMGSLSTYCTLALQELQSAGLTPLPNDPAPVLQWLETQSSYLQDTKRAHCNVNETLRSTWAPDPRPNLDAGEPGLDTSNMECKYGNPYMFDSKNSDGQSADTVCCGMRPHFNWILGTCERRPGMTAGSDGQFCTYMPECFYGSSSGGPAAKINYIAAYQFDAASSQFVLMDKSTCGDIAADGVSGKYPASGFEVHKDAFLWNQGDWTTKYAPSCAQGNGSAGPRGVTPPAGLFVLSAQNAYYLAFYMLSQLGINLEKWGQPTGTNCWLWELDPVEGTAGWSGRGWSGQGTRVNETPWPGKVNQLYFTDNAAASGCMPVTFTGAQTQGNKFQTLMVPEFFQSYCRSNPTALGCTDLARLQWSGTGLGSNRFENAWDQPYIFVVVIDGDGYWTYRYIPEADGSTPWPGISQFASARRLVAKPAPIKDIHGLQTDVKADVKAAVILEPALKADAACLRSIPEVKDWQWGNALFSSVVWELNKQTTFPGSQNWWNYFCSTGQLDPSYPASIMGVPLQKQTYTCNSRPLDSSCACGAAPSPSPGPGPGPGPPHTPETPGSGGQNNDDQNQQLLSKLPSWTWFAAGSAGLLVVLALLFRLLRRRA